MSELKLVSSNPNPFYHIGDKVRLKIASKIGGIGVITKIVNNNVVFVRWASGLHQREFISELIFIGEEK